MNEIEAKTKIAENQGELQTAALTKKVSFNSKQWDLAKKSTQASSHINYEINQTQTSLHNLYGENKFKIQYEITKKEELIEKRNEKRFSKFEVKIDHRRSSKIKALSSARTSEDFNFRSQLIEIKPQNKVFSNNKLNELNKNNFETIDSTNKVLRDENSNIGFSLRAGKNIRRDAFGVLITKKSKKHKVTFLDELQKKDSLDANNLNKMRGSVNLLGINAKNKLSVGSNNSNNNFYNFTSGDNNNNKVFVEEIKIESYKKYYSRTDQEEKRKAVCSPCGCNIF